MAIDDGTNGGIELVDSDAPAPTGRPEQIGTGPGRTGTVVALVLVVVVLVVVLVSGGDGGQASTPPEEQPSPEPPASLPVAEAPTLAQLAARPDAELLLAIGSTRGDVGRVLQWGPTDEVPVTLDVGDLRGVRFDRSGRWVAGVGLAPRTGGGAILWAGPVGAELEPVQIGVRGYAWHDSRDGLLAWSALTATGEGSLLSLNLEAASPHRRSRTLGAEYRLRHWGDWGYALAATGRSLRTTVLDPAGGVLAEQEAGFTAGWIPGAGLTISSLEPPREVSARSEETGFWLPLDWAAGDDFAWDVALDHEGRRAAVHLASGHPRLGQPDGRIVVVDDSGTVLLEITEIRSWAAMSWTPDGETLVFVRQSPGAPIDVVLVDVATGEQTLVPIDGLDARHDRVEAVRFRHAP
jgi:hypothetical protein